MQKIFTLLAGLILSAQALTLPKSIYKNATITPETDYAVYDIMRDAKKFFRKGNSKDATPLFIRALLKANKSSGNKVIDQYDYLYAHHGILTVMEHQEKEEKNYIRLSKKILRYLDKSTSKGIWEEGELGQFQLMMYKRVGNNLANLLYKQSQRKDKKKMQEALHFIKKAEKYIRSDRDFYIKETKEKITNALDGKKPLEDEKAVLKITKIIKKKKEEEKVPQKQ